MLTGWWYRIVSGAGVVALAAIAVLIANLQLLQTLFTTYVPLFWRLEPVALTGRGLYVAIAVTAAVTAGCLTPLFKPRPRRILDIVELAHKRVLVAGSVLATLGFFNYTYRLPRATLVMTVGLLFVAIPLWFVVIRRSPGRDPDRAVVVGDDPDIIDAVLEAADLPVVGYVAPAHVLGVRHGTNAIATDGAGHLQGLDNLGGLSRLDEVLVAYDVDTALLAFEAPDRGEFFGALDTCYDHGVTAKVHRRHADSVLASGFGSEELVDVELEPWDTLDHIAKRAFDVTFAGIGLLVTAPIVAVIAVAIKLDDGGPILYGQERTATFGDTFHVYKFRSMVEDTEDVEPMADEENPYITDVGHYLRRTHLDEIPQLYSILIGDMSVVGPRAVWTDEEVELDAVTDDWRKRWFVKPGLTGLAQINDASSTDPDAKLRYDIEYIRRQSFWFDLKIVTRQLWKVAVDVGVTLRDR
ncbi:sugar transferase [Natronomonas gomsonensis]|uniref:sugar transferase n=1 Tax=Natronomonas gomsonensis TaxID=1046043 RepID=UPI00227D0C94|nr:sugar transferase [Natronomonas gomsonensis]MCY4732145.1 sugar transferase [Natronomonas gomsonensis]